MNSRAELQKLKDSVSCGISMCPMEDPHILPCGHTYDNQSLLDAYRAQRDHTGSAPCPNCRAPYTPAMMQRNYQMRDTIAATLPLIHKMEADLQLQDMDEDDEEKGAEDLGDLPAAYAPTVMLYADEQYIHAGIKSPERAKGSKLDLALCIDGSGSMDSELTHKGEKGEDIRDGLTTLDLVKHSAKALLKNLDGGSRVSIVVYATDAKVLLPMTVMNEEGKREAESIIDGITAGGCTNLWGGIEKSMDELRSVQSNRNSVICLLTDGIPTASCAPTRGYKGAIRKYMDRHTGFTCTLNMIGFGYSLDSALLNEMSQMMNGAYCFVPDASMVGTTFIHLGANIAVTAGVNACLKLEFKDSETLQKVLDDQWTDIDSCYTWTRTDTELTIELGNVCYGQNRSVVIPRVPLESVAFIYTDVNSRKSERIFVDDADHAIDSAKGPEADLLKAQLIRQILVSTARRAMNAMVCAEKKESSDILRAGTQHIMQLGIHKGTECDDILTELTGQIKEALSRDDWFNKWGKHYIPSLVCAHISQQCNNFKDPGVQALGGKLFQKIRDQIEELFIQMPAPNPAPRPSYKYGIILWSIICEIIRAIIGVIIGVIIGFIILNNF